MVLSLLNLVDIIFVVFSMVKWFSINFTKYEEDIALTVLTYTVATIQLPTLLFLIIKIFLIILEGIFPEIPIFGLTTD